MLVRRTKRTSARDRRLILRACFALLAILLGLAYPFRTVAKAGELPRTPLEPSTDSMSYWLTHTDVPPAQAGIGSWVNRAAGRVSQALTESMEGGSYLFGMGAALIGGVLLAFTPCVLPMVPIVVQVLVGGKDQSHSKRVLAACVYTFGLALVYAVLGLLAAQSGGLIGGALQNPYVLIGFACLFGVLALSMFDVFELAMPAGVQAKLHVRGQGNLVSAFVMGAVSGIVASPCIGPMILAVLALIAKTQNPTLGFAVLFTMGVGLGTPFIVAATIGGHFLRPGPWMVTVKKALALLLLIGAAYFVELAGHWVGLIAAIVVCVVMFAGGLRWRRGSESTSRRRLRGTGMWQTGLWGAGLCALFGAVVVGFAKPASAIAWRHDMAASLTDAKASGRPALMYFTADWCIPCRELKATTLLDPVVVAEISRFVTIKLDLTRSDDPDVEDLVDRFGIVAPPVMILVDSRGTILESNEQRINGLIDAPSLVARLQAIQ